MLRIKLFKKKIDLTIAMWSIVFPIMLIGVILPLAAQEAFFPFGVYDKAEITPRNENWRRYYSGVFNVLVDNNLNTILTVPYRRADQSLYVLNRAQERGVRVILGTGNPLNHRWDRVGPSFPFHAVYTHPNVIAIKSGDEPQTADDVRILQRNYGAFRYHYDLPLITAMVGEGMTGRSDDFTHRTWRRLNADILFARFYPLRRTFDLVEWSEQKMLKPFEQWAADMERNSAGRPWWYIMQTFGRDVPADAASYWRLPTESEINALGHIALANGARGIVGFALQRFGLERAALLDSRLVPMRAHDGSTPLNAMRELGALIRTHTPLLLRHRRGAHRVRVDNPVITTVPRLDPVSNKRFVYVINRDGERASSGTVTVEGVRAVAAAQDLYTGRRLAVQMAGTRVSLAVSLAPGAAQLWELQTSE